MTPLQATTLLFATTTFTLACTPPAQDVVETGESTTSGDETSTSSSSSTSSSDASPTGTGSGDVTSDSTDGSTDSSTGGSRDLACDTQTPAAVLFVNFDGAELINGLDDAPQNTTQLPGFDGTAPPYGEGEKRVAVLASVRALFAPYNIAVVDERPADDYSMIIVGPHPELVPSQGIAPLDCMDQVPGNIAFVHVTADDGWTAEDTAIAVAGNVGPMLGLEHTFGHPEEVMNDPYGDSTARFTDACVPTLDDAQCSVAHEMFCAEANTQNSHAELLDRFGACPE